MSDYRAIAGVSSTLRTLLRDRMEQPVTVTIAPPDLVPDNVTGKRVNLYLFRVDENGLLKNQEIPGQGHPGDFGRPPLSLNLFYLITSYGSSEKGADADLEAQQILGDAMRVLHDFAVVPDSLKVTRAAAGVVGDPILDSVLRGQFEQVKLGLEKTSLEEFSKIWTALPQANFRRAVVYEISVIQIESRQPRTSGLPVRERRVHVLPFRSPQITEVFRDPPLDTTRLAVAEPGDTVTILGANLASSSTRVLLGSLSIPIPAPEDGRLSFVAPAILPAGIYTVQVVVDLMLKIVQGQPKQKRGGWMSNVAALLIVPKIVLPLPAPAAAGATVTVNVSPAVLSTQQASLLLDDFEVPAVPVTPGSAPRTSLAFQLPAAPNAAPAGVHLMRVRVDGAESRLTVDPLTQAYNGPSFTAL